MIVPDQVPEANEDCIVLREAFAGKGKDDQCVCMYTHIYTCIDLHICIDVYVYITYTHAYMCLFMLYIHL